jgi:hypothetical protein
MTLDELTDRGTVADRAFNQYIEERKADYYLADTEGWSIQADRWTRRYWLGSRTRLNASERTFLIDFVPGTNTIERQWQE